jgi:hypothetical protein
MVPQRPKDLLMPSIQHNDPQAMERPERRGVSRRSVIEEAKMKVKTIALADRLCGPGGLRRSGETWVGRCPLPDHEDKTPSFAVYPESNSFFCFGCLVGGDVVELARHAWGHPKEEVGLAAAYLLLEFGYEVPPRPPAWFRKQERQRKLHDGLEEVKVKSAQRRLMRLFEPYVNEIEDVNERREEAVAIWNDLAPIARQMIKGAQ